MKLLLIIVVLLVLSGLVLYLLGHLLPLRHTARHSFTVPQPRALVWKTLTDYAGMPRWWPAVKSVRFETRADGRVVTWNTGAHGQEIGFFTRKEQAPVRFVREMTSDNPHFGGSWTFELADTADGTRVTISEDGFVRPAFYRAIAHYIMGYDSTMKDYGAHLTRHLRTR